MTTSSPTCTERVQVNSNTVQTGWRSTIGRTLMAVMASVLMANSAVAQIQPSVTELVIDEDNAGPFTYTFFISTLPTDPINFALTVDSGLLTVDALIGTVQVPDASAFTYDPSSFAEDTNNAGLADVTDPNNYITISLVPVDNNVVNTDPNTLVDYAVTSTDATYNDDQITNIIINDDEVASVTITESGGSTELDESSPGTTDGYTLVLGSQPTNDVTVTFTYDNSQFELSDGGGAIASGDTRVIQPGDFATGLNLTVTVNDDMIDEADAAFNIMHAISSPDANYNNLAVTGSPVAVNFVDDDTASATITESGGSTDVSEANVAQTDDYTLVLGTQPTATVTVEFTYDASQFTLSDNGGGIASGDTREIAPGDFATGLELTVTALDDDIDEADAAINIAHTLTSTDANYNGLAVTGNPVAVNFTDDDAVGVTITESGSTDLDESAPLVTDGYTLVLGSEPTDPVTVTFTYDASQFTLSEGGANIASGGSRVIQPADFATALNLTVTVIDDLIDEDDAAFNIMHDITSADPDYNNFAVTGNPVAVNFVDDDTASATITESAGSTQLNEAFPGLLENYTLVLGTEPTDTVTVEFTYDASQFTLSDLGGPINSGDMRNIAAADFATGLDITVTVIDDAIVEANANIDITHTLSSSDTKYNNLAITGNPVTVSFTDDDNAGVTITETGGTTVLNEADPGDAQDTDTYSIVLTSQPTQAVNVTFIYNDDQFVLSDLGGNIASGAFRTIQPADFATGLQLTATVLNDEIDENNVTRNISHTISSADAAYNAIPVTGNPVTVNVLDDDTAGVILNPTIINATEGGAAVPYTIRLASQPAAGATVTVNIAAGDQVDSVTNSPMVFSEINWNVPQQSQVTVTDDAIVETDPHNGAVEHNVTSVGDSTYNNIAVDDLVVSITDNDVASVIISEAQVNVTEGGANATYTIVLGAQPSSNVVVQINTDDEVSVTPAAINFTPANFATPVLVTVSAVDDDQDEGGTHNSTITHTVTAEVGSPFNGLAAANVQVEITDNDTAGISVSTANINVTEGGISSSYTVVLDAQPASNVTIDITADDQVVLSTSTLIFTPGDFGVPQQVTVTASDDNVVDGTTQTTISHSASSGDAQFDNATVSDVTATVTDNDTPSISIDPGNGVFVSEDGPTSDSYTIQLDTVPTGDVTITITTDGQTTVNPAQITLNADTLTATITVTAITDGVNEGGTHESTITHSVVAAPQDAGFQNVLIDDLTATVSDEASDTDGDGLVDSEEEAGFTISVYIPRPENQGGLLRRTVRFFTDPTNPDTDGDGIRDFDEVVTFARLADSSGSVPGTSLGASAARQIESLDPESGAPVVSGILVFGPGQDAGLAAQSAFRPKPVWGVRTLASDNFSDDSETAEALRLLSEAGITITGRDTDADGIADPDDDAPQFNPVLFGLEGVPQAELLDFDIDRDGFPEISEVVEINEEDIEGVRAIDYSNDGSLADGFDFGALNDNGALRVVTSETIPGLIGDGRIETLRVNVDTCPEFFNPDNDGDGIQDDNSCQDAPTTQPGAACCGGPFGFSLALPLIWSVAARRGSRRRK